MNHYTECPACGVYRECRICDAPDGSCSSPSELICDRCRLADLLLDRMLPHVRDLPFPAMKKRKG